MSYYQQQQPVIIASPPQQITYQQQQQPFSATSAVQQYINTNTSTSGGTGHNSNFSTAAIQPYIFPRIPPTAQQQQDSFNLYAVLNSVTGKNDLSPTFWVPDTSKGEYSLLAALVKRQSQHHSPDDFLPIAMRPDIELANNFSTFKSERIDLSGDKFKLSKATQTLSNLTKSAGVGSGPNGEGMISVSDVKEGLRSGISMMQTDEYFLVKYRDYSQFAVNRWPDEAQRERFLSPKYVEKYFAVRVGSQHGVFVPISETQFVRGTEILSTANMSPETYAKDKFFVSLSSDQFKSLGAPSSEFMPKSGAAAANAGNGAAFEDPDLDLPPPPHPLDFSAEAFNIRWKRFARRQYHNFGRLAIKIAVVGAAAYFIRYYYFGVGWGGQQQQQIEARGGNNGRGRSRNSNRGSNNNSSILRDVASLPLNLLGAFWSRTAGSSRDDFDD